MNKPFFSVVITTYNRYNFLEKAINSVLNQTINDYEIIVIDDNKTPNKMFYEEFSEAKVFYTGGKTGCSNARNCGICNSQGNYIAFLDDDDIWHPDRLKCAHSVLKNKQVKLFVNSFLTDFDVAKRIILKNNKVKNNLKQNQLFLDQLVPTSAFIVRKDILLDPICFDINLPAREDYDFLLQIVNILNIKQEIEICLKPLTYLRREKIKRSSVSSSCKNNIYGTAMIYHKIKKTKKLNKNTLKKVRASHQKNIGLMALHLENTKIGRRFIYQSNCNNFKFSTSIIFLLSFLPFFWHKFYLINSCINYKKINYDYWIEKKYYSSEDV